MCERNREVVTSLGTYTVLVTDDILTRIIRISDDGEVIVEKVFFVLELSDGSTVDMGSVIMNVSVGKVDISNIEYNDSIYSMYGVPYDQEFFEKVILAIVEDEPYFFSNLVLKEIHKDKPNLSEDKTTLH